MGVKHLSGWGVMFPGQGSQFVGMGQALVASSSVMRQTFEEADDAIGYNLSTVILEGPEERLRDTEVQQPAILALSVAIWRTFKEYRPDFRPVLGFGLSLGEYSAYVASGVLTLADGVRLTKIRGRAMQEAVPKGEGGMVAILGLKSDQVEKLCREASLVGLVETANYNAPGQTVVSGLNPGLDIVEDIARKLGARTVRLAVSAPFHCRLLKPAGEVLSAALSEVHLGQAAFPVLANVDTAPCMIAEDIVPRLIRQVSHPVLFEHTVERALSYGLDGLLELGPGRSLSSLVKKINRHQRVVNIEDPDGLARALELV